MKQEDFNITWHTFTDHLREMLHDMRTLNELTDVTLVSEDKKHFKAHKVVLSACSPVFKSIISENVLTSPLIYLRGIQSDEIETILQFIYLGEATLYQDRMKEFLKVAQSLEIKEINTNIEDTKVENTEDFEQDIDLQGEDSEPKKESKVIKPEASKVSCNECGLKYSKTSHLNRHVRAIHEGLQYTCEQCDFMTKRTEKLQQHVKSVHEGVKYQCDQCSYEANQMGSLKHHIKSTHEGVKFTCDKCSFKAKSVQALQYHIKAFHKDGKYNCDQENCTDKFASKSALNQHAKIIHEGFKYSCDQCDFESSSPIELHKHVTTIHMEAKQ